LGLVVACGSGDDDRHPAVPAAGGSSGTGGARARGGSSSTPDEAGQGGETIEQAGADAGGEGGNAGEPPIIYEMGGLPQNMPGLCDPAMTLGDDQPQVLAVPGATLLSMTADELSIAFSTGKDAGLALYVADRASLDDDFAELLVPIPDGYAADVGVALASDGLTLVLPRADGDGLGDLSREARGAAFGSELSESRFAKINGQKLTSGRSVGWPVLSQDGKSMYYVSYASDAVVFQTTLNSGVFDIGTGIDPFTLGGASGKFTLLSALAADSRTIFFLDQATKHATARFRSHPEAPFYDPLDLGERQGAAPNADCTRVYSTVEGKLVYQARQ
jgi:hypothetical protein